MELGSELRAIALLSGRYVSFLFQPYQMITSFVVQNSAISLSHGSGCQKLLDWDL